MNVFDHYFSTVIACILGVVFIALFAKIFYFYAVTIKKWNATSGEVVDYDVVYQQEENKERGYWKQYVSYAYTVNGTVYHSQKITENATFYSSSKRLLGNSFSIGEKVTVYYNPKKPKEAVLDNDITFGSFIFLYLGIILIGVIFIMRC